MATLMQASHQWANRPSDQRKVSLIELDDYCRAVKEASTAKVLSSRAISCAPMEGDSRGMMCVGPNGTPVAFTHWSFGQICQRANSPAGYLRELPAELAADCLNYRMQTREVSEVGALLYQNDGPPELRALTGPNYGRVWNHTITSALRSRFGDGLTGDFRVPGEFGVPVPITKDNTTLYASDRDMFVFLADEKHLIEVPGAGRNGTTDLLSRGFFVWNSEVGAQTFGIATFVFRYVCKNRIVWGAAEYEEIRLRHTAAAPDRWIEEVAPALEHYAESSTAGVTKAIEAAREARIDKVDDFLLKRFTRSQTSAIKASMMTDEQRPIETLWDAANAVTAYARGIGFQDERVNLEREAGKILKLAA